MKQGLVGCRSAERIQCDRYVSGAQPSRTQGAFCAAAVLPAKSGDDASRSKVAATQKHKGNLAVISLCTPIWTFD